MGYDMDDDDWGGSGNRPSRDQIRYEMARTAAARIARDDPEAFHAARSTRRVDFLKIREADEIGSRLAGFGTIPRILDVHRAAIRAAGISERIGQLDSSNRLLLMGADNPGEPDHIGAKAKGS